MRLTSYTDYSLRVLLYLGLLEEDRLATIGEISETYSISANHLMKVVHNLGKLGYVETVRGRTGGMRLARPPEDIRIGRFVREVEPDFAVVECLDTRRHEDCVIAPACRLQAIFGEAVRAFVEALDRHTLADLLAAPAPLAALLGIERPA